MFEIQQKLLAHLPAKRKQTTSGWISFNAPCCHHQGHRPDLKGRGGLLANHDGNTSYHCFNCGFTANWKPGRRLNLKMRKFMQWIGIDPDEIRKLSLFALSQLDQSTEAQVEIQKELPKFDESVAPGLFIMEWLLCLNELDHTDKEQFEKIVKYIDSRGLSHRLYDFKWSNDEQWRNRIIIPFTWQNKTVGFSGRLIGDGRPKYFTEQPPGYLFNYDKQMTNAKFCLVMEGYLDAMALGGLSIGSNECSEQQAYIIESLNREVVVVPDRDKAGTKLIADAMEYGWNVAFPDWGPGIKDVSDAVRQYGQLFTMRSILNSVETSNLKIQLMSRKWIQ